MENERAPWLVPIWSPIVVGLFAFVLGCVFGSEFEQSRRKWDRIDAAQKTVSGDER